MIEVKFEKVTDKKFSFRLLNSEIGNDPYCSCSLNDLNPFSSP